MNVILTNFEIRVLLLASHCPIMVLLQNYILIVVNKYYNTEEMGGRGWDKKKILVEAYFSARFGKHRQPSSGSFQGSSLEACSLALQRNRSYFQLSKLRNAKCKVQFAILNLQIAKGKMQIANCKRQIAKGKDVDLSSNHPPRFYYTTHLGQE